MDIMYNMAWVILMGLIAVVAGMFEDLESDIASTSNPNSQVQLAPEIGYLHKLFNRAVSGEPLLLGCMLTICASLTFIFLSHIFNVLIAIFLASLMTTLIQVIISITSYMGRITSQALYNQPLFMDVIYNSIPTVAAHAFITLFSITLLSYIIVYVLTPPIALTMPIVALCLGISVGSIGSSIGDIYYGAEVLYQNKEYGSGISVSDNGQITTKSALGARTSTDIVNICSKFAGPLTGLCFGLIIFLSFWIYLVAGITGGLILGVVLILIFIILNYYLERESHEKYGKYEQ